MNKQRKHYIPAFELPVRRMIIEHGMNIGQFSTDSVQKAARSKIF